MAGILRHDQLFLDDGSNVGFFKDGDKNGAIRADNFKKSDYKSCEKVNISDDEIKKSVENVRSSFEGQYSLAFPSNNCQQFADAVIRDALLRSIDQQMQGP